MEFDETPKFWCPRIALVPWINFAFSPDENLRSDFHRSEKEAKRKKNKKIKSLLTLSPSLQTKSSLIFCFGFFFLSFYYYYYNFGYMVYIVSFGSVSTLKQFIFFLVHFILNELSSSHFLTSEIFVKISSLKSLATYHPENCKIFRLSQNLT